MLKVEQSDVEGFLRVQVRMDVMGCVRRRARGTATEKWKGGSAEEEQGNGVDGVGGVGR